MKSRNTHIKNIKKYMKKLFIYVKSYKIIIYIIVNLIVIILIIININITIIILNYLDLKIKFKNF